MGADIHGVLQSQWAATQKWYVECRIEDDRNYALFSALAGVRNYNGITPIAEPRGLPEDFVSRDCAYALGQPRDSVWIGDHSFTWLTLKEIKEWDGWDQMLTDEHTLGYYCETFLKWVDYAESKVGGRDGRIVIGFDS